MPCETDYIIVGFQPYSSTELTVAIIWNGPKLWPQIYVYGLDQTGFHSLSVWAQKS